MTISTDSSNRLKKTERQTLIVKRLEVSPAIRISELAADIGVSTETIRRDLAELEEQGLISRTYGGAARPLSAGSEVREREAVSVSSRQYDDIARVAATHVHNGDTLLIGSGAAATRVAVHLASVRRDLTVFTDCVNVAGALSVNPHVRVHLCPGLYHDKECCVYGPETLLYLKNIYATLAILGASGLTEDGPNNADFDIAQTYLLMSERAGSTIVVADHSTISQQSVCTYMPWHNADFLIMDQAPYDEELMLALKLGQVKVEVAANAWGSMTL